MKSTNFLDFSTLSPLVSIKQPAESQVHVLQERAVESGFIDGSWQNTKKVGGRIATGIKCPLVQLSDQFWNSALNSCHY